jgi:hypothetical protein
MVVEVGLWSGWEEEGVGSCCGGGWICWFWFWVGVWLYVEDDISSRAGSTVGMSILLGRGGIEPSGFLRLGFMMRFGAPPDPTTSGKRISMYSS